MIDNVQNDIDIHLNHAAANVTGRYLKTATHAVGDLDDCLLAGTVLTQG